MIITISNTQIVISKIIDPISITKTIFHIIEMILRNEKTVVEVVKMKNLLKFQGPRKTEMHGILFCLSNLKCL